MLIKRPFWENLIEQSWKEKNIIWLMGVRRVGKTSLCLSLENIEYFDCERPRVRQLLSDPEAFLESNKNKRIVLDEIHRLENPSEILKLAADHYPEIKIIATGSSTLSASAKFRDTLTGRKREIWLTPLLLEEMKNFGNNNIRHRFLNGGLPSFFIQNNFPEIDFREWIDGYWAKDVQELFKVGKRYSFSKFAELLLANSSGQFEASKYSIVSEVTRQTILNYLEILEETFVIHVIRPYSTHKSTEIVMSPKVYGFDTGFTCYSKGWNSINQEDLGLLWKQIILNEIHAKMQTRNIHYWRDKKGHEIDFIIEDKVHNSLIAIECKFSISQEKINEQYLKNISKNILAFRSYYPKGENFIVASDIDIPFERKIGDLTLFFTNPKELIKKINNLV